MNIFGNQTTFILKHRVFPSKIAGGDFDIIFSKTFKYREILEVCQISFSYDARRKAVYYPGIFIFGAKRLFAAFD